MLLGPDSSARLVYVPSATFASAAGQVATVYAAATGATLAVIRTYDGTSTPGAIIAGSQVTVNADSQIPLFWYPDNVDTVWIEVGTGTRTEVPASIDMRVDRISGDVVAPLIGTGLVRGGEVTVNVGNPKAIDVAPFLGYIVDYTTNPSSPTVVRVETTAPTTVVLDAAAQARIVTWFLVDSTGAFIQQPNPPTDAQRRTHIQIGALGYDSGAGVIFSDQTLPVILSQPVNQMYDLFNALGPFPISGNVLSPNGANLMINKTSGTMFVASWKYFAAGVLTNDPHISALAAQTPASYRYLTQAAASAGPVRNTLDVANYDVGGVVTPIGGGAGSSTIHRVWGFGTEGITEQVNIQYGQTVYSSLSAATAAIGQTAFVKNPDIEGTGALLGWIAVTRTATDLSNPAQAFFQRAGKFANP